MARAFGEPDGSTKREYCHVCTKPTVHIVMGGAPYCSDPGHEAAAMASIGAHELHNHNLAPSEPRYASGEGV